MKQITSIIVDYNSVEFTKKAIKSLLKHDKDHIERIIVVDNYGLDNYFQLLNISPKVMIIRPSRNIGFGAAMNLAMKYVNTPYVLLQNPDTILENSIMDKLLLHLSSNGTGAVVPKAKTHGRIDILARRFTRMYDILAGRRSPLLKFNAFKKISARYRYLDKLNEQKPFEVDAFTGTFVLIKKEIYMQIGGFDKRFFLFMEDVDLSRRLREKGYKIYTIPNCTIFHYTGATRGKIPFKSSFHKAKSVYLYFRKWNELSSLKYTFVGLLLGLYTILIAFLDFIGFYRPEPSWKKKSEKRQ